MKKLLIFLFGLIAYFGNAALVDYSAFLGTNEVLVSSNTLTGKILIGPAAPFSQTASNAAKSLMVWTNSNNQTRLSRYPAHNTNVHRQIDLQYDVASDDGAQLFGLNLSLNDDNSQSDDVVGIFSAVNLQPNGGDRALYNELGVWGLVASVDIGLGSAITNGETVALYGDCSSGATLQYGVGAHVTPPFNGQTNVGVASSIDMRFAPSALAVGAYLELTPVITNPSFEPAILLLDNRTTNSAPLIVGRTNNGSTVYRVNRDGSQLVAGFITNTALLPSKFVSTGSGTNLTSSAYGDSDIAGWLSRSNGISGYNNRIVQLKTNSVAVQTLPLGAIDLNVISSPTIGYQATNSAGENEIQFSTTAAVALTTDLNNASNALKSAASMTYIPIQSGFANSLTGTNGTNIGPLTIKNATASRIAIFDGSQILSNAPALTAGQYLTFNGSSYVASNLPPSGSQTPWTSDINAAGFALSNAGSIETTGTVSGSLTLNASNGNGAMNFSVQHNLPVAITNVFNFSNAAPGQVLSVISSNNFTVTWGLSNAPSGLPASPTNTIQYNNAGSFGAIANPNTNSWGSSLQWSGTGWAFRPLDAGWIMDEEFLGDGAATTFGREAWRSSLAGSGAHASRTIAGDLGVVESVIFNAADQAALLIGNGSYITIPGVTNQEMYCLMRVQIWQTLTNSTDIGQVRCGIIDNANNSPANGIYWQNTNNCWEAVCGRSSSFTVGTTASNSVNGAWIYLAWYLNQTGTNVDFFIGTSTTNLTWTTNINAHIPDSQPMTPVLSFRKSVGSTKQTNYWGSYRLWSNPFTR